MIDLQKAMLAFKEYLTYFDQNDEGIALKIKHTYRVMEYSKQIAESLQFSKEAVDLAQLIALLHDIGRFEQIHQFHFFDDQKLDHAKFGVIVLFQQGLIRNFINDKAYDTIIQKAIWNHNLFQMEDGLNEKELLYAKIIRDADKLDIFRVKVEEPLDLMYHEPKQVIEQQKLSDEIYHALLNHQTIKREWCITMVDRWFMTVGFLYDIYFDRSKEIIQNENLVFQVIDYMDYKDLETVHRIRVLKKDIKNYLNKIYA